MSDITKKITEAILTGAASTPRVRVGIQIQGSFQIQGDLDLRQLAQGTAVPGSEDGVSRRLRLTLG